MSTSLFEIQGTNKDVLIVTFGGCMSKVGRIPPFEFLNTLTKWFPDFDKKFYIDLHQCWYHKGIQGISTNIAETKTYLEGIINGYKKVLFIGNSAGGYAAILFGSLLHVQSVLAFVPQTILSNTNLEIKYRNLKNIMNTTTKYYLYGDTTVKNIHDHHHVSHIENVRNFQNVQAIYKDGISLQEMRDSGELQTVIVNILDQPAFP